MRELIICNGIFFSVWHKNEMSNLEERARCSQRHIQGYLSQNELYPARLPHQHLAYQAVPQVLQIAAVFLSFFFLFITKIHVYTAQIPGLPSWVGRTHAAVTCDYLSLHLQKHGLPILWLHLCFHWPALFGGGLSRQRVRKLHEEQLVIFAKAPSVQQVRQNLRLRERRRFENGLWLLYFNFLRFLFYWRAKCCQWTLLWFRNKQASY